MAHDGAAGAAMMASRTEDLFQFEFVLEFLEGEGEGKKRTAA